MNNKSPKRDQAAELLKSGPMTQLQLQTATGVHVYTVQKWINCWRDDGSIRIAGYAPRRRPELGGPTPLLWEWSK
jgi:transposase